MRETCARVLAAALLTGAIGTVVAMSALFRVPDGTGRPFAVPPSALRRTVPVVARPAARERRVVAKPHPAVARPHPVIVTRSLVVIHRHASPRRPRRVLAATTPAPPAGPPMFEPRVSAPAEPVQPQPAVTVPAASQPDEPSRDETHGHAYGHDKHGE